MQQMIYRGLISVKNSSARFKQPSSSMQRRIVPRLLFHKTSETEQLHALRGTFEERSSRDGELLRVRAAMENCSMPMLAWHHLHATAPSAARPSTPTNFPRRRKKTASAAARLHRRLPPLRRSFASHKRAYTRPPFFIVANLPRALASDPSTPPPSPARRAAMAMADPAAFSPRRLIALSVHLLLLCVAPPSPALAQLPVFPPSFVFDWSGGKSSFVAGETAVITIRAFDLPPGPPPPLSFTVWLLGTKGNSTYLSDVVTHIAGDPAGWTITLVPLRAGDFYAEVTEDLVAVGISPLPFTVTAAGLHPPASPASWALSAEHAAGAKAAVCVVPRDAFGNAVPRAAGTPGDEFFRVAAAARADGSPVELTGFRYNGWTDDGCLGLEFVPTVAGDFLVHVYGDNMELRGSPLQLTVTPGALDMEKSTCSWKHGTNLLQIFSKLEVFIHQKDSFGNLVQETHPLDVRVVKSALNVSVPVVDLLMEAVADGIQLLSFNVVQPGEFNLTFFDPQQNQKVSNMVCTFDVFVGLCNGSNSFANGSGLAHSVAGSVSSFNVFLQDLYSSPYPIETALLQVRIQNKIAMHKADPIISPLTQPNETVGMDGQSSLNLGPAALQEIAAGDSTMRASQFHVSYTPQIAGEYEIWVQCGNIVLNGGNPYTMSVSPGAVSTSLSRVFFDPKIKPSIEYALIAELVDSFMNPVVSSESKLLLTLRSSKSASPFNMVSFVAMGFVDNRDGSYTSRYYSRYPGLYGICAQYEQTELAACPLEIQVLPDEYFSDVKNDYISVWENESVSFDVLLNDYIAGSKSEILNTSIPLHGSALLFNRIYRYTPFEGYVGNDSFVYTVVDGNNNAFHATVFVAVLCKPPQFVSLPQNLRVTEDILGPKFGGFPGIKAVQSDKAENISVTVKAQSGSVFLAPMPMKIQQPTDYVLSVSRGGSADEDLILHGTLDAINDALQFLQYIGNADFYGSDVISLHAMNRNGALDATFPIFVEPINDPPVILAPETIFLRGNESRHGYHIFDKHRDTFQFAIVEPDLQNFPGNKSHLLLVLSIEVSQGSLMVTLPRGAFTIAELKTEGAKYWQPLVNIANQFVRKTAIRFRGDIDDCNYAMQHLFYHGPINDTTLTISVNDLGNYGCYPDCSKKMSKSLTAMKTIRLVKTRHMKSRRHLWAEPVLAIEFTIILCLGAVLLYYFLKCLIALMCERRHRINDEMRTPEHIPFHQHPQPDDSTHYSAPANVVPLGANSPGFRRRSSRSRNQEMELQPVSRSPLSSAMPDITTTEERRSSEIRAASFAKLS
ncbi:hypothetical protein ACP4OV_023993 [Aristida adscensionis]